MARERKFSTEELFGAVKGLLLEMGYEGFTFSLLAERLDVSRGALYKYYENKDKLIADFMTYEMEQFILELKKIEKHESFEGKFNFIMDTIFERAEVHHLIRIAQHMMDHTDEKSRKEYDKLKRLPLEMYRQLQGFIALGKKEGNLKPHIDDSLMLGMIFQTIAIPNHFGMPRAEWIGSIKEILSHGMFNNK